MCFDYAVIFTRMACAYGLDPCAEQINAERTGALKTSSPDGHIHFLRGLIGGLEMAGWIFALKAVPRLFQSTFLKRHAFSCPKRQNAHHSALVIFALWCSSTAAGDQQ